MICWAIHWKSPVIIVIRDPTCHNHPRVLHKKPDLSTNHRIKCLILRKSQKAHNKKMTMNPILKYLFTPVITCNHPQVKWDTHAYGRDVMPYIEGPCMDWMVNDGLYHWFRKWHLKCKNILECELAALLEWQQCKKVFAWSGDCRMDQYMSWDLSSHELTLETIWGKYEEYCKPQSNEVQARFGLLMSFRQGNCSIDEWYNAVQAQVNLAKYPPRNCQNTPQGHFLVLLKRWIFCIQDHQWWKCQLRQVSCK